MPVAAVPCQPRGFDRKDGAHFAAQHRGNESLKPWPIHKTRTGSPKILVDHNDVGKAQLAGTVLKAILAALALVIVVNLSKGRLSNVNDGAPFQMIIG
jgi:hypothetical protein